MQSDSDIRCAVEAELSCHPLVDDTDIAVNVKDGVVTLSGYARNLFHKYGAEDAVKRVAGVTAVANTIAVGVINAITVAHPVDVVEPREIEQRMGTGAHPAGAP